MNHPNYYVPVAPRDCRHAQVPRAGEAHQDSQPPRDGQHLQARSGPALTVQCGAGSIAACRCQHPANGPGATCVVMGASWRRLRRIIPGHGVVVALTRQVSRRFESARAHQLRAGFRPIAGACKRKPVYRPCLRQAPNGAAAGRDGTRQARRRGRGEVRAAVVRARGRPAPRRGRPVTVSQRGQAKTRSSSAESRPGARRPRRCRAPGVLCCDRIARQASTSSAGGRRGHRGARRGRGLPEAGSLTRTAAALGTIWARHPKRANSPPR